MKKQTILIIWLVLTTSCSSNRWIIRTLQREERQHHHHCGFYLYNPQTQKIIADYKGDKYFTPASTTKILTLYTCTQLLNDSITALKYIQRGDSTIFWGMGDPSFLNPKIDQNPNVFSFLQQQADTLFFSDDNYYQTAGLGPGWAWDDYLYSFSANRSPFPIYGNLITLTRSQDTWVTHPRNFIVSSLPDTASEKEKITRPFISNELYYSPGEKKLKGPLHIPFYYNPDLITRLLSDTLKKTVQPYSLPIDPNAKSLYSTRVDSVFSIMMHDSDNLVAEQLLLQCAASISDTLNSDLAIEYAQKEFFDDLPDSVVWIDGSGLSRYNLLTPRSTVRVWEKMEQHISRNRIWSWLAVGGQRGTLKSHYTLSSPPYLYAKTGTLNNHYNLSGYILTRRGNVFLFAYMNTHYTGKLSILKSHINKFLYTIYQKY